ncbi:MAG: transcriptional regulator, MarR family [Verrucomicrobiales bacterium]|nr:transcriptional regulator, MarR family [Verrucomicrobiales bacterium]
MPKPTTKALPIDAPARRRIPILLRRAWYGLNQAFRRRIAPIGVTPDQFTVLRTLLEHEKTGLTQSELTREMGSDANTIGSLVLRIERAGWINRARHERDRRAYHLKISAVGRAKYKEARKIAITLQEELLAGWSEKKREEFLTNLAQVADRCRSVAKR